MWETIQDRAIVTMKRW